MNGLYIGSMGMMNYMQRINVHSNNVANAQTTGFKAENMTSKVFDVQDTYRRGDGAVTNIGSVDYAVVPAATHVNLVQGNIQMTNSATDFFLDDGAAGTTSFFVTSKNDETFLTRDGSFTLNSDRYLQTSSGAFVMGENNERIRIPEGAKVAVQADGTLYDEVTQNNIARLQTKTVDAETNARLVQRENKSFTLAEGNIANLPNGTGIVKNHMLENSNVDMTKEMADLMTDQKMIQASQRVMTSFDKIYEKEANEILR
ncbi:flagellar basal-body rod protein FlgG [Bacillus sp. 22475]|jgi:flagellar basal-body rod protein FlgG|uniref:Flagellar basal-body rod protein flgG n=31 Tax=Bacillus cereus group TaxID=86661 RepID=Q81FC3_BACCR|nr:MULTISPECIES: flagellar basal-body rod protein FlgG [Bacillus]MCU7389012.1 flagellar basal-body rod protein FlgG [Bacillus sp. ST24]MEB4843018.1 flagellar basal-body rod protein FlgG [Paenibacillus jamilae]MED1156349.1 flagellar basal-body rod protein FlgG [Bacillus paranthracis]PAW42099.1 flagellar basal body rod protein FlgG [Bacillus toyonensis]TKV48675.1 flagellar basal-body rod protein FlgG [Bacillus sp. PIC28]WIV94577.1 flagellar basal-body rod protein FlgG [Bacillus bombysepticus]C